MRNTKIIATIGPMSRDRGRLEQLFAAGMDCARLNFSHGTLEEHDEVIGLLRELSQTFGRPVAIMQDLGGIKLRLGQIDGAIRINLGDEIWLVPEPISDRPEHVPFPQPSVLGDLRPGNLVYISDGTVCLEVLETDGTGVKSRVVNGGIISSFKGVNLPGVPINLPVLTENDKVALRFGAERGVDWVALSFVRGVEDIQYAKSYLEEIGSQAALMAKLERSEGVENIDSILQVVDGVMVARGDLGVEIPMQRVPIVQKDIVRKANEAAKISVIATQMLYSMVISAKPTRAEVSDVTNAVLDGCDAILLSDETAIGQHPVQAMQVADTVIREAETVYPYYKEFGSRDRTQAMAAATSHLVRSLDSKPIVITSTGRAALEVSRDRPHHPIMVFSHGEGILRKLSLGWGLIPMAVVPEERDVAKLVAMLISSGIDRGMLNETDVVTIVYGYLTGVSGTTNTVQVVDLREYFST